jgi:hypothetical protein
MNNSSAQDTYSITLDDTITLTSSVGTITFPSNTTSYSYSNSSPTISIGSGTISSISSISSISTCDTFKISLPEEWVNTFPEWDRVEKMCQEYPGLRIAFDKFKTVYKLVKDDYDTPKDKRAKP